MLTHACLAYIHICTYKNTKIWNFASIMDSLIPLLYRFSFNFLMLT